jgi:hypothetical protein
MRAPYRVDAYCALSTAASVFLEARRRASGHDAGSPARVALADLDTSLADRRAAHTLACGHPPEDVNPSVGNLTMQATLRIHRARGFGSAPADAKPNRTCRRCGQPSGTADTCGEC